MKALVGPWDDRPYRLLAEITALRARVAELEEQLQRAREESTALRAAREDDRVEVALSTT
ncbi:MAG TPA: hypothetical protein VG452_08275 [Egibacteraceae bacterium]|nr:hypothetical protein [Egibacteraceae bacterium]